MHCIVGTPHPPFLQGGIEPASKFSKRGGGLTGPQLLEIFNDKKSL